MKVRLSGSTAGDDCYLNCFSYDTACFDGDGDPYGWSGKTMNNNVYFYSETKPIGESEYQYWHYVNGEPTVW